MICDLVVICHRFVLARMRNREVVCTLPGRKAREKEIPVSAARYVGRVGRLAVVLGVGAAVATGHGGVAWANSSAFFASPAAINRR